MAQARSQGASSGLGKANRDGEVSLYEGSAENESQRCGLENTDVNVPWGLEDVLPWQHDAGRWFTIGRRRMMHDYAD